MMDFDHIPLKVLASDIAVVTQSGWLAERGAQFRNALLKLALVRHYRAGESLYLHGDVSEGLYAIVSGAVTLSTPADDGQEFAAHRDGAGFWVGDSALLSGQTRLVSVTATCDTRTLFVPSTRITEMVRKTPDYFNDFYALNHENMKTALRILANLAVTRTDQRLALRLLHLDEPVTSDGGWIEISQDQLAAMVAVSVATLQRVLRDFAKQDLVELGYGRLRVLDRRALLAMCQT